MLGQRTVSEKWDLGDISPELTDALVEDIGFPADVAVENLTPHELGILGEALAGAFLISNGYEILEHGYRCREGEADYVAYDSADECIVLVEVKTRRRRSLSKGAYPEEAVDARKRKRYRRIAASYLMDNFPVPSLRFDTIGVVVDGDDQVGILQACGAFDWECEM